jgi:flagellar basal body-associated protein FliL
MARKRKRTQINLTINFGKRVYQDAMTSLYEAKDTVTGNKLLVLITDESFETPTSIDVAQEIRKNCDKINVASIEVPSLFPIIDSGLLDDTQAFFMSSIPNATPLILKEFSSVEEVVDLVESMTKILSLVHSLELTQGVFNLKSEWYCSEDNALTLIFPGVRGLFGKLTTGSEKGKAKVNTNEDLMELCNAFDQLLRQVGVDVSIAKVTLATKKLAEFKDNLDFGEHSAKSFLLFLNTLKDALSHVRQSSFPTIHEDSELATPDLSLREEKPVVHEPDNEKYENISSFGKNERLEETSHSSISPNPFTDILKSKFDLPGFDTPSSGSYTPPQVEVFEAPPVERKSSLSRGDSVSRKFSDVADTVYGDEFVKPSRIENKKKLHQDADEASKRGLLLILIAFILVIVILALVFTIYSELSSKKDLSKNIAGSTDSLQVFDSDKGMLPDEDALQNDVADNSYESSEASDSQYNDPEVVPVPDFKFDEELEVEEVEAEAPEIDIYEDDAPREFDPPVSPLRQEQGQGRGAVPNIKEYLESLADPIPSIEVSRVISYLESDDFEIRIVAIRTLGEKAPRNDPRTRIAIESMLNDEDTLVRGFAAFGLVAYSGKEALPILEDRLTFEKNEVVNLAISRAISKLK